MAYVKHTFSDGDVLTADYINNIENGIENLEQKTLSGLTFSVSGTKLIISNGTHTWEIGATT